MIPGIDSEYTNSFLKGLITFTTRRYDKYLRNDKQTELLYKDIRIHQMLSKLTEDGYEVLCAEELDDRCCTITILQEVELVSDYGYVSYRGFNCSQSLCEGLLKDTVIKDGFKFTRLVGHIADMQDEINDGLF